MLDIAPHIIDTHVQPSTVNLNGIPCRGLADIARHVVDSHFEPSSLDLAGTL
jgi:hypothetical protein